MKIIILILLLMPLCIVAQTKNEKHVVVNQLDNSNQKEYTESSIGKVQASAVLDFSDDYVIKNGSTEKSTLTTNEAGGEQYEIDLYNERLNNPGSVTDPN